MITAIRVIAVIPHKVLNITMLDIGNPIYFIYTKKRIHYKRIVYH